jgi:DNA helicase-2/ATP-dependent DNA helicase PcrA
MRLELQRWDDSVGGIAAISFTNVAGDEIRAALGYSPGHQHFIGTIDAFLYRYVVRPFASWAYRGGIAPPCLIPADYVDFLDQKHHHYKGLSVETGPGKWRVNIFKFAFHKPYDDGTPSFTYTGPGGINERTSPALAARVFALKKRLWRQTGRMSHSDVAFLAAQLLTRVSRTETIISILSRRFPFLIIDELQDTGRYHILAYRALLKSPHVRGLLVGDPDQSIYGFNGADPRVFAVFAELPGARILPLAESLRCAPEICAVANQLSWSKQRIVSSEEVGPGRAILLVHDGDVIPLLQLARDVRARVPHDAGPVAILARRNDEVNELLGEAVTIEPRFQSSLLQALFRAGRYYRAGQTRYALATAEAGLARLMFGGGPPTKEELDRVGITRLGWRKLVGAAILVAEQYLPGESAYDWGLRIYSAIRDIIRTAGLDQLVSNRRLRRLSPKLKHVLLPEAPRVSHVNEQVQVKTVHGAKGETHHTTIYYVSQPRRRDACPSELWWSTSQESEEERRIAFVAVTRARKNAALCLHRSSYEALMKRRSEFVRLFQVGELRADRSSLLRLFCLDGR